MLMYKTYKDKFPPLPISSYHLLGDRYGNAGTENKEKRTNEERKKITISVLRSYAIFIIGAP